jgi:LPS export ABC transporter protein LptC
MAVTRDSEVTSASARSASHGIVLAGDRTGDRISARRHSRAVRGLKFGMPLVGLVIAGFYGLSVLKTMGWGSAIAALEIPQIIPENLAMQNPHYEGFNKDGGRYWVKADSAQQDLKAMSLIKLNGITGELTDAKKLKTTLTATRGTFDNKENTLELFESIDVAGESGMKAHLTQASIDTKEQIITSNEPVQVMMEAGSITANQMTARQKAKEYTFVEDVRTHLNARDAKEPDSSLAAVATKPDAMIGSPNAPVDITSNRLDVNETTKIAVFSGMVTAIQDGASMTTPELEVTYIGSALPQAGATATTASAGKLKRLIAKNPVALKQANGDTVTSRGADFDPVAQRAILDGDVVMVQLPDKRATADKAEIDQTANAVLLTGDVVVTQGQNILKGRRLVFNRGTNKMQLTSPGASGAGGRINARFQQAQGAQPSAPKADAPAQQGIAFGASFKTDPGAPVSIDAVRLDVDDVAHLAVFTGDVQAVQGDFVIRAAEIAAAYSGSAGLNGTATPTAPAGKQGAAQLTRIKARTKVQITSKDGQNATGDWADFDPKANMATLGGNVVLTQGKNVIRGTKLVIDMTTGESTIKTEATADNTAATVSPDGTATAATSSTGTSGRPTATFFPGEMKARGQKPAAATASPAWQAETTPSGRQ